MERDLIEKIFIDYKKSFDSIKGNLYNLAENNETPDLAGYMMDEIGKVENMFTDARYDITTIDNIYNEDIYNVIKSASEKLGTIIGDLYDETKKGISEKYDEPLYNMCTITMSINNFASSYIDNISTISSPQKGMIKIGLEEKNRDIDSLRKKLIAKKENSQKK